VYRQKVEGESLKGMKGILAVAAVMAAAMLGSAFFTLLGKRIGNVASLAFIAYCCAIAWFVLTYYVMGFVYSTDGDCLRVCRIYGKRERFMCDVWLNKVQAYGTPEEMQKRYPEARVEKAVKSKCELACLAIAYATDGKVAILHIQPDATLRGKIIDAIKKK